MRYALAAGAIAAIATPTLATFTSFASDSTDEASIIFGGASPSVSFLSSEFELFFDDEGGALPEVSIIAAMNGAADISYLQSIDLGGGLFEHVYSLAGSISMGGEGLTMDIDFSSATFTVQGGADSWGTSGSIFGADLEFNEALVTFTLGGDINGAIPNAADYGIFDGASTGIDSFGFTMTNLVLSSGGAGPIPVDVNAETYLPFEDWESEASFSGRFVTIPAPAALLALLPACATRRRRVG